MTESSVALQEHLRKAGIDWNGDLLREGVMLLRRLLMEYEAGHKQPEEAQPGPDEHGRLESQWVRGRTNVRDYRHAADIDQGPGDAPIQAGQQERPETSGDAEACHGQSADGHAQQEQTASSKAVEENAGLPG